MKWQPIETAPKNGTKILLTGLDYGKGPGRWVEAARFSPVKGNPEWGEWWAFDEDGPPTIIIHATHWMPFPPPPEP